MATVTLDRLYLHDATNLATYLRFYTTDRADKRAVPGTVRAYANGRLRSIVRAGRTQQLPVKLTMVSDGDMAQLDTWQGALLMLRDHRGRLLFGSYFDLAVDDYTDRSGYDLSLTFQQVTHSIAV